MMLAPPISSGAGRLFTDRSTLPCQLPRLPGLEVSACFHEPRIGGDFFDVACAGGYLYLVMTDIAGERSSAQRVAAEVQEVFRQQAAMAGTSTTINETVAAVELLRAINGAIMSASAGVRCAPTFLAVYNLSLNLVTYISAGAPAAVLFSDGHVRILESTGIPLGLFTHLTHDPMPLALEPGARLVLVSKGVLEARQHHAEFGIQRVCDLLLENQHSSADNLCSTVLTAAEQFCHGPHAAHTLGSLARFGRSTLGLRDEDQDMTVLTLARA
jgi:serine phosphatase RsbU (regulator of sigma subunit)